MRHPHDFDDRRILCYVFGAKAVFDNLENENLERSCHIITPWSPLPVQTLWHHQLLNRPCWAQDMTELIANAENNMAPCLTNKQNSNYTSRETVLIQNLVVYHSIRMGKDVQKVTDSYYMIPRSYLFVWHVEKDLSSDWSVRFRYHRKSCSLWWSKMGSSSFNAQIIRPHDDHLQFTVIIVLVS